MLWTKESPALEGLIKRKVNDPGEVHYMDRGDTFQHCTISYKIIESSYTVEIVNYSSLLQSSGDYDTTGKYSSHVGLLHRINMIIKISFLTTWGHYCSQWQYFINNMMASCYATYYLQCKNEV